MTPSPLPARRVRLFGRERDAAAVRNLLATAAGRLVTILGPGGCGKTSLALEVVHEAIPSFADDGYWIALDACTEPSAVTALVASAVVGPEGLAGTATEALAATLEGRQALLVLDNCEHVRAAVAPLVDELLGRCPDLRILTTSRAPLNVRGEQLFILESLAVPGRRDRAPTELAMVPSVALFLDRSRAAGRTEPWSQAQLEVVSRICQLLDGLPLAIELAAAQMLVFSPEQVAEHLEASLPLPPRTAMVGPERQQTMQRALDWSYQLLADGQKRLLMHSGVFGGPWTLQALEALSPDSGDVALGLARLVEHSLVTPVDVGGERRYQLLAPVREYARALQDAAGQVRDLRERHARYYAKLLEATAGKPWSEPYTPEQVHAMNRDHENYLVALAYAHEEGRAGLAFHLTTSLWVFWRLKGQLYLGYERFRALAALEPHAVHQRAAAQGGMANFAQLLGNRSVATNHATLALALYREATLPGGEIMASGMLAEIAAEGGNYAESRDRWQAAMTLVRDEGAPGFSMALALIGLGVTEYWDENLDEAERLLHEALEALGGIVTWHRGSAHIRLGSVARRRGLVDAALTEIREGLRVVDRLGGGQEVAQGLEELEAVEHVMDHPDRAATFLGAASALRDSTRSSPAAADAKSNETLTAALQAALGEAAFASAWVSGRALSRSAVLQLAASDLPAAGPFVAPLSSLTGRELEVAQLVAAGLSNAQIAAELVISDATARTHVERIRGKLGVHSRVQIARLVLDSPVESARSD